MLATDFRAYRDELIISTKAGYLMWPGPYGEWGSRKYLLASLDQSLKRMGLDYVDIFYSHRVDPKTPLEETMGALDTAVRQGKALYAGISSYNSKRTAEAARSSANSARPPHPPAELFDAQPLDRGGQAARHAGQDGVGCICFSPLAQGMLTDKYLKGVPAESRAASGSGSWRPGFLSKENLAAIRGLNDIAKRRGQTLAQMAIAWVLRDPRVTSALIGASRPEQITDAARALDKPAFSPEELGEIDNHAHRGRRQHLADVVGGVGRRSVKPQLCRPDMPEHEVARRASPVREDRTLVSAKRLNRVPGPTYSRKSGPTRACRKDRAGAFGGGAQ